jgi:hypothetical protein
MVASGHVDKGAIYSIAGDSKWAASPNFDVRLHTLGKADTSEELYCSGC